MKSKDDMMVSVEYDSETDSIYFKIRNLNVYETVEFNANILIDLSHRNEKLVGLEILDASRFISKLFAEKISKSAIKDRLVMHLNVEREQEITLDFELGRQKYAYAIPKAYASPILAV